MFRCEIPVTIDNTRGFNGLDLEAFRKEIQDNVRVEKWTTVNLGSSSTKSGFVEPVDDRVGNIFDGDGYDDVGWDEDFPFFGRCDWCRESDTGVNEEGLCQFCFNEWAHTDAAEPDEITEDVVEDLKKEGIRV